MGPLGAEVSYEVKVKPVPWPVPSVESLWLGVKPENKQRRMKAFLSCMRVGSNSFLASQGEVPECYLLICCVLRSVKRLIHNYCFEHAHPGLAIIFLRRFIEMCLVTIVFIPAPVCQKSRSVC